MEFDHRYVFSFFTASNLNNEALAYVHFHKYRFAFILNQIALLREKQEIIWVLDIGPSYLTNLINATFNNLRLETLGLSNVLVDRKAEIPHYQLDLNFIGNGDNLPSKKYDLVIFAEVIEHLYTDPGIILKGIHKLIKPGGYLFLQTPNAVSIDKRIKMLFGTNPYQSIIPNRQNHFREYTVRELKGYFEASLFVVMWNIYSNYFNPDKSFLHRFFRFSGPMIPPSWRDGITILAQVKSMEITGKLATD